MVDNRQTVVAVRAFGFVQSQWFLQNLTTNLPVKHKGELVVLPSKRGVEGWARRHGYKVHVGETVQILAE